MARKISDLRQYITAYKLFMLEMNVPRQRSELERLGFNVMADGTLREWNTKFKGVDEKTSRWDKPYIWRRTKEYGIPDDMVSIQNILSHREAFMGQQQRPLSFREAKWIWYIDSTCEGFWGSDSLIGLALQYSEAELKVAIAGENEEESFKAEDVSFDTAFHNVNALRKRRSANMNIGGH